MNKKILKAIAIIGGIAGILVFLIIFFAIFVMVFAFLGAEFWRSLIEFFMALFFFCLITLLLLFAVKYLIKE